MYREIQLNVSEEIKQKRIEQGRKLGASKKGIPHTEEHKNKIIESRKGFKHSEETKKKLKQVNLGRKQSPETIEKRSRSMMGHTFSKNTIEKIRRNQPGRKKINQYDLQGNFIKSFDSINDAARELNVNRICISRNLRGGCKRYRQWVFKYIE